MKDSCPCMKNIHCLLNNIPNHIEDMIQYDHIKYNFEDSFCIEGDYVVIEFHFHKMSNLHKCLNYYLVYNHYHTLSKSQLVSRTNSCLDSLHMIWSYRRSID